jgi:hypothetical protein
MVEGDPAEGEIPALRWNVPPLNESCMRVKVWETQSERRAIQGIGGGERRANNPEMSMWKS